MFVILQVSAVTDQAGMQDAGANMADLDDDEGSGLVSLLSFCLLHRLSYLMALTFSIFQSPKYVFTMSLINLIIGIYWLSVLECTLASTSDAKTGPHRGCFKVRQFKYFIICFIFVILFLSSAQSLHFVSSFTWQY